LLVGLGNLVTGGVYKLGVMVYAGTRIKLIGVLQMHLFVEENPLAYANALFFVFLNLHSVALLHSLSRSCIDLHA